MRCSFFEVVDVWEYLRYKALCTQAMDDVDTYAEDLGNSGGHSQLNDTVVGDLKEYYEFCVKRASADIELLTPPPAKKHKGS